MLGAALALGAACGARTELLPASLRSATRAEDAGPPGAEAPGLCVDLHLSYQSAPATVLLLVDQSGSMNQPFGGGTRWSVLRQALFDETRGVVPLLAPSARFGLMLYTSFEGFAGGACPVLTEQSIALDDAAAIRDTFDDNPPLMDSDTPTGESVAAASATLQPFAEPGPKYILLVTDGEPDTCAQPDPQNGQAQAIAAARAAHDAGILLRVLGVSDDVALSHLQHMANASAGLALDLVYGVDLQAARPYQASDDPAELAQQLQGILGEVRSCTVHLDGATERAQALAGKVVLDGDTLVLDAPDGYRLLDETTLELLGSACETVLGDAGELVVQFPCAEGG